MPRSRLFSPRRDASPMPARTPNSRSSARSCGTRVSPDEKFIIFTEHRDTAEFLVRRLEGLGFTGQVALIHGGLDYRVREAQVELFRRPLDDGGANYLVATDAAGEGINLQFCWLMVNYDVPWNPARLEQRMGRIHRYGQKRDPVIIVNLVAGQTREGRVMKTLLDKLELIRKQLGRTRSSTSSGGCSRTSRSSPIWRWRRRRTAPALPSKGSTGFLPTSRCAPSRAREHALFGGGDVKSHSPSSMPRWSRSNIAACCRVTSVDLSRPRRR